ncbi:hypothetical protein [Mesorhizobium koreense]|uniref:hypothetical protein n=1 Tax=Mesorhizobium koreense TaxID=3074855 RepID=UPI00287B650B|nr:hypothetical protein [Mesorhizobium sp. WR6]
MPVKVGYEIVSIDTEGRGQMPIRKAAETSAFGPDEIAMFWRVFSVMKVEGESEADAEHRASRIIANYEAGIRDEKELLELSRKPLGR